MSRPSSVCYSHVIDAMGSGHTVREVCDLLNAPYHVIRAMVQELRSWPKRVIYVSEWRLINDGQPVAVYAKGSKADAKRKPKVSQADRCRMYREKVKDRETGAADRRIKQKVADELSRPAFRHPQDVAFFGKPPIIAPTTFEGHLHVQPMEIEEELEAA